MKRRKLKLSPEDRKRFHPRNTNPSPKQLQATRDNSHYGQLCMTRTMLKYILSNQPLSQEEKYDLNLALFKVDKVAKDWLSNRQAYRDQM